MNVRGNVDVTAYALAVVGTYPINNDFTVFGKLGAYSGDVEINENFGTAPSSISDDDSDVLFGLGLKYNITKQFSVRGEWERYNDSDNPLDLFSIGVAYKF